MEADQAAISRWAASRDGPEWQHAVPSFEFGRLHELPGNRAAQRLRRRMQFFLYFNKLVRTKTPFPVHVVYIEAWSNWAPCDLFKHRAVEVFVTAGIQARIAFLVQAETSKRRVFHGPNRAVSPFGRTARA